MSLKLYLIEILHQTTTSQTRLFELSSCILSKFYIKPQLSEEPAELLEVVSYRNSTSNHNQVKALLSGRSVVSYRNSTSNHNYSFAWPASWQLYLIEILHQTTTCAVVMQSSGSCILSKFYIKPQLRLERELTRCVVSYRNSTSNHNS